MNARDSRSLVAAAVAVVATAALLVALNAFTQPLGVGTVMRESASLGGIAYGGLDDAWLLVRLVLGVYMTAVFAIITLQLLSTWRTTLREGV